MTIAELVGPDARCCCNCGFWRRHYVKIRDSIEDAYWPLEIGHCANPKRRRPKTKPNDTCKSFTKEENSDAGSEDKAALARASP